MMSSSAAAIPIATVPGDPITSTQHAKSTGVTTPSAGVEPDPEPATHAPVEIRKGSSSLPPLEDQTEPIEDEKQELGDTLERSRLGRKLLQTVQALKEAMCSILEEEDDPISPNLEHQIGKIQSIGRELEEGATSTPDTGIEEDSEEEICEVKRYSMDEWKKAQHLDKEADKFPRPVIVAYYRDHRAVGHGIDEHGHRLATSPRERQERPQRVVIHSQALADELEDICEFAISSCVPIIMASPYKLLVKFYPRISERISELQSELARLDKAYSDDNVPTSSRSALQKRAPGQKNLNPGESLRGSGTYGSSGHRKNLSRQTRSLGTLPASRAQETYQTSISGPKIGGGSGEQDITAVRRKKLQTRLRELQLAQDLVNVDLAHYLNLRNAINTGSLEKVSFEDLWHLFRPGDLLFCTEQGHDQLYKVYFTTGGQPRKRNQTNEEKEAARSSRYFHQGPRPKIWDENLEVDVEGGVSGVKLGGGSGTWSPFTINCYRMGFNGILVGPVESCKQIKYYPGERSIHELPVYPFRFHQQQEKVAAKLEARGRKYVSSQGHRSYRGLTIALSSKAYQEEVRGDVFVDVKDLYRTFPILKPALGTLRPFEPDAAVAEEEIGAQTWYYTDGEVDVDAMERFLVSHQAILEPVKLDHVEESPEYLQLFPYYVAGYIFKTRRYTYLDIDVIAGIDKSDAALDNGFDDLVIPDGHRNLLTALVRSHTTGAEVNLDLDVPTEASTQIDIVRGKGRGLIVLLHGPPGSGKTSTAETLAAYTKRPLYSITCGDLGAELIDVEKALTLHTTRAQQWGCVLLLDEADVFLTRRDFRDTVRNGLVSIFLRQMEYYSGILFLTTNRVGVMDEAFKSRIHVSLAYPDIRLPETKKIWGFILDKIKRDNTTSALQIRFDREALLKFAERHYKEHEKTETTWNGRQIRNAFQVAIALGKHARDTNLKEAGLTEEEAARSGERKWMTVKLTTANFRSIATTATDFEDYLTELRGGDSKIAKDMLLRHDAYYREQNIVEMSDMPTKTYRWQKPRATPTTTRAEGSSSYLSPISSHHGGGRVSPSGAEQRHSASGMRARQRSRDDDRSRDEEDNGGEEDIEEDDIIEEDLSDE